MELGVSYSLLYLDNEDKILLTSRVLQEQFIFMVFNIIHMYLDIFDFLIILLGKMIFVARVFFVSK
jgi:hypothetical protein